MKRSREATSRRAEKQSLQAHLNALQLATHARADDLHGIHSPELVAMAHQSRDAVPNFRRRCTFLPAPQGAHVFAVERASLSSLARRSLCPGQIESYRLKVRALVYCQNAHRVVPCRDHIESRTNGYRQIGGKGNGTRSLDGPSVKNETNYYQEQTGQKKEAGQSYVERKIRSLASRRTRDETILIGSIGLGPYQLPRWCLSAQDSNSETQRPPANC